MSVAALKRMKVPEFVAWAERQPRGRYELVHGVPVAMAPQRIEHAETKVSALLALKAAIQRAGLLCHGVPDGLSVRVDDETVYEPDALVYCGPKVPNGTIFIEDPVIVVEVVSPTSEAVDTGAKLAGYFKVPSVAHYLIINPLQRVVTHHARWNGGLIETRIRADGDELQIDPPGLSLTVAALLAGP
jgi:Uma2 family endonuclease